MQRNFLLCASAMLVGALSACGAQDDESASPSEAPPSVVEPSQTDEATVDSVVPDAVPEPAPSPTPERKVEAEAPAPIAKSPPRTFRDGVLDEMQTLLGHPVRTRQDALNATYRKIGWRQGTAPTDRQNRDAYHQAMAWGFTVGRLAREGRDQPLVSEDIAEHPLEESVITVLDRARGDEDVVGEGQGPLRGETLPLVNASSAPEPPESAQEAALRQANLARLTERVNQLNQAASALDQSVAALEREAKGRTPSAAQRGSLRTQRQRLEDSAREAESKASELSNEVQGAKLQ